jgi:hypothetical protein
MKDPVTIPREEYECLRRHLNEAMKIFQGLEAEGAVTAVPMLSPKEARIQKYERMLLTSKRAKKTK